MKQVVALMVLGCVLGLIYLGVAILFIYEFLVAKFRD